MQKELMVVCGLMAITAIPASGQTKFSGSQTCTKPDPNYTVAVDDRMNHVMSLTKDKCTWTKGELAGVQLKVDDDTIWSDISGAAAVDRGYGVTQLANGDKAFVRFDGRTTLMNDAPVSGRGTWTFTGGTGKLKGLKGKGTYTGKYASDGSATFDVEGDYQLPTAASKK